MRSCIVLERVDRQGSLGEMVTEWVEAGLFQGTFFTGMPVIISQTINYSERELFVLTRAKGLVQKRLNQIQINDIRYDVTNVDETGRYTKISLKMIEENGNYVGSSETG